MYKSIRQKYFIENDLVKSISILFEYTARKEDPLMSNKYREIISSIFHNIKVIFHFAEFSRIYQSFEDFNQCFESNSQGTQAVFKFCLDNKIKLIYSATSATLGNKGEDKNLSPYAFTKSKNLELLENFKKWFSFRYEVVYFYNVYGEKQICKGDMATVIGIFEDHFKKKKKLPVVRPGTQVRRFTHVYDTVKEIYNNPIKYLSGIDDDYNLININPKLATTIQKEVGEASAESFTKLYDRRFRYGFNHVSNLDQSRNGLAHEIASRKDKTYHSVPSIESTDSILTALWELDRFPLLVVLDPIHAEEQLHTFANHYRDILDSNEQSVLFRSEEKDAGFNQLIKDRKLNNWVDKTTKVVYISKNKLPKLIVKNDWKPTAVLSYNSKVDRHIDFYNNFNCDLIIYREESLSPFRRYSKYYG